uniref:Uncharacterized protein n=1 Tax=Oryza punctata TaxID=4537 RepID=A0A0E0M7W2_ORYPU
MDNKFITAFMLITLCKIIAPTISNQPSMQYANVCLDVDNIAKYNWAEHMLSTIRNAALQLLYLDYVDAPGCNVTWGEPRVAFWTNEEAKPLKQTDKGSGLYAVYGSCKLKNVETICYAKAFEPHEETINIAGLGPYVDLVRQLDDGSFSFEICADAHITNAEAPKKVVNEVRLA